MVALSPSKKAKINTKVGFFMWIFYVTMYERLYQLKIIKEFRGKIKIMKFNAFRFCIEAPLIIYFKIIEKVPTENINWGIGSMPL